MLTFNAESEFRYINRHTYKQTESAKKNGVFEKCLSFSYRLILFSLTESVPHQECMSFLCMCFISEKWTKITCNKSVEFSQNVVFCWLKFIIFSARDFFTFLVFVWCWCFFYTIFTFTKQRLYTNVCFCQDVSNQETNHIHFSRDFKQYKLMTLPLINNPDRCAGLFSIHQCRHWHNDENLIQLWFPSNTNSK